MPRTRKPTYVEGGPGAPTQAPPNPMQAPSAPTGMPYGEHQASIESQQQMPIPNGDPFAQMAQMVQSGAVDFGSVPNIDDETDFPDEPITAGLPIGAGPGIESQVAPTAGRVQSTLELIADLTGDPEAMRLAQLAAMRRK